MGPNTSSDCANTGVKAAAWVMRSSARADEAGRLADTNWLVAAYFAKGSRMDTVERTARRFDGLPWHLPLTVSAEAIFLTHTHSFSKISINQFYNGRDRPFFGAA